MDPGKLVFAQLMDFLPRHDFNACVRRYGGDHRPRGFSCRDQFLCLAFAQLTFRESLRDIETCLRAFQPKLYHAGFRGRVSRSTLADANRAHDWRIFADFAQVLIGRARTLYAGDPMGVELEETVYALDSTTIDLCLSLFPWSPGRQDDGFAERPDDRAGRPEDVAAVPGPAAAGLVLRRQERQAARVPDQQLHPACADDRESLQMSMASRVVLQMDQTELAYQVLL